MACFTQFRDLIIVILLWSIPLDGDEAKDLQKRLQRRFVKQVFTIRNFYGGNHRTFDSQGNLLRGDKQFVDQVCWCAAQMEVKKLEIKQGKVVFRGHRIVGIYDSGKGTFSKLLREPKEVQVDIELDPARMNEEDIVSVLEKIILTRKDDLNTLVPDAWRAADFDPTAHEITKVKRDAASENENVSAPKVIHAPDPDYSSEARRAGFQGDLLLEIVVDEKGNVARIRLTRCLGMGLDEQAVQAVSQWKFDPAMRNGQPVAVQLNVEVNFHLYR